MKKIITSLLLGIALLTMVVSCSNNASEAKTNGAVFENYLTAFVTYRIKSYENSTWELELENSTIGQKTVMQKGTHKIDFTKDGYYVITPTHINSTLQDDTFDGEDSSTWGNLVEWNSASDIEVELAESGSKLIMEPKTSRSLVFIRK